MCLFKYTLSVSYYTGESSTTNTQVHKERYLTDSINHERKQQVEREHAVKLNSEETKVIVENVFFSN